MLSKEYLDTARTILRAAQTMTDQHVAGQLKALAEDYERRADKASHVDAAKASARRSAASAELVNPAFSTHTKTDSIGLFTGQFGYAWNASLFYVKGGAAVTRNSFSILDTLTGFEFASASATRWGGTVVPDGSMALRRIGLWVLNTTICS